jgi:hypothetical protein
MAPQLFVIEGGGGMGGVSSGVTQDVEGMFDALTSALCGENRATVDPGRWIDHIRRQEAHTWQATIATGAALGYRPAHARHGRHVVVKAAVAVRFGGPEAMVLKDVPEPTIGPRDVLVDVRAASLNPVDAKIRAGGLKLVLEARPPIVLGCDVAGVVKAVGADVRARRRRRKRPGDQAEEYRLR